MCGQDSRKRETENEVAIIFEEILSQIPKLIKKETHRQENQWIPTRKENTPTKKITPTHIIVKLLKTKDKDKILQVLGLERYRFLLVLCPSVGE